MTLDTDYITLKQSNKKLLFLTERKTIVDFLNELKQEADRILTDNNQQNEFLAKFVQMPDNEGSITLRFLPPTHDLKLPWQATRVHRVNGKSFHCRKELTNGRWQGKVGICPICDYYNWLWNEANNTTGQKADEFIALARDIKPVERFYYNAVVREDPSQTGVKIYSCGKKVQQKLLKACVGDKNIAAIKALGNIFDVTGKEGRDFIVVKKLVKSGSQKFPNYDESYFVDPSPLAEPDEVEKLLASAHVLSELRNLKEPEELRLELKKHLGLVVGDDSEFDPREYGHDGSAPRSAAIQTAAAAVETVVPPKTEEAKVETPKVEESKAEEPPFNPDPPKVPEEDDEIMSVEEFMKELGDA